MVKRECKKKVLMEQNKSSVYFKFHGLKQRKYNKMDIIVIYSVNKTNNLHFQIGG